MQTCSNQNLLLSPPCGAIVFHCTTHTPGFNALTPPIPQSGFSDPLDTTPLYTSLISSQTQTCDASSSSEHASSGARPSPAPTPNGSSSVSVSPPTHQDSLSKPPRQDAVSHLANALFVPLHPPSPSSLSSLEQQSPVSFPYPRNLTIRPNQNNDQMINLFPTFLTPALWASLGGASNRNQPPDKGGGKPTNEASSLHPAHSSSLYLETQRTQNSRVSRTSPFLKASPARRSRRRDRVVSLQTPYQLVVIQPLTKFLSLTLSYDFPIGYLPNIRMTLRPLMDEEPRGSKTLWQRTCVPPLNHQPKLKTYFRRRKDQPSSSQHPLIMSRDHKKIIF